MIEEEDLVFGSLPKELNFAAHGYCFYVDPRTTARSRGTIGPK